MSNNYKMCKMLKKLILVFLTFLLISFANAKDNFVFGLGMSVLSTPAYIGSEKQNLTILPFPYIEYTGEYFSIDRDKIYNEFYNTEKMQLELSLRGMLPSKSEDTARVGMPDLDAMAEIGPKLTYNLFAKHDSKINLEIPIRAAFSVGDNLFEYQGYFSSLDLNYENYIFSNFKINYVTGFGFSDKRINNYYYEVDSKYVNANRSEYHSKSGYSDFHNTFSITKKENSFWYGAFIKHYYLDSAVYEDSPLVETKSSIFSGLAFSYLF